MYNECSISNAIISPIDLRDRTLTFAKGIIRFAKPFRNPFTSSIIDQLIRSSTSVGANFIEAKNASSKKDFRNKVFISKKEASETLYWLKLCEEFTSSPELFKLQKECQEIILILQKIINTLKN
jgi:four helix bundle protein